MLECISSSSYSVTRLCGGAQTNSEGWPYELTIPSSSVTTPRKVELRLVGATATTEIQIQAVAVDSDALPNASADVTCLPWSPPPSNVALQAMVLKTIKGNRAFSVGNIAE
eukprot:SAG31_NODE_2827_length_5029_cov_2.109533_2_plen_111_part_00